MSNKIHFKDYYDGLEDTKIKMIKSNSRQLKKGLTKHIDLQSFEKDYPEFVFDGLSTLDFYIKKHCLLDTHNSRLRKFFV